MDEETDKHNNNETDPQTQPPMNQSSAAFTKKGFTSFSIIVGILLLLVGFKSCSSPTSFFGTYIGDLWGIVLFLSGVVLLGVSFVAGIINLSGSVGQKSKSDSFKQNVNQPEKKRPVLLLGIIGPIALVAVICVIILSILDAIFDMIMSFIRNLLPF